MIHTGHDSVFQRNVRITSFIKNGEMSAKVLEDLLPGGIAHSYEKSLWDYKQELPTLPRDRKPSDAEKEKYSTQMAAVVKDVVSFYNSHGGYLIIGIDDKTREVVGFNGSFDCGELVKKVLGATKHEIDCHYHCHQVSVRNGTRFVGLLLIPRRPDNRDVAQFRRDAPIEANDKQAFKKGQIYFRQGDACKPAETSEDFMFLCSPDRRNLSDFSAPPNVIALSNNLGPRDPGFIKFIGRESYLRELWQWLCDPFSPVKLLAGLGGVGKTTLAREFVEALISTPPAGLEKVIWLSAKKQLYTAALGQYRPTSRVDFIDTCTLLRSILEQLGYPENAIDPEWSQQDLMEETIDALRLFPSFLVIDDIDSLVPEQQQDVFHTLIRIIDQTLLSNSTKRSRALLTARLDLGAAPGQLIRVKGLDHGDFCDYVEMTANSMELTWSHKANSQLMQRFYSITDGSPTFTSSILKFVSLGKPLDAALSKWKGSDGEEVRRFAFERELNQLTESQIRTLYAASLLGATSVVELQNVLQSSETLMNDDIGELRRFHLIAMGTELPGGARIEVPSSIQLLSDLIKKKVRNPVAVERECETVRKKTPDPVSDVGRLTTRVLALWRINNRNEALSVAKLAERKFPNHPDVQCLLGRAYLRIDPPDLQKADAAFRQAFDLNCSRPELLSLWTHAKVQLKDWIGILEITRDRASVPNFALLRARAYAELGEIGLRARNHSRAASHYRNGLQELHSTLQIIQLKGPHSQLLNWKRLLAIGAIQAVDQDSIPDEERLSVWKECLDTVKLAGVSFEIVAAGARNLRTWWGAVEKREKRDKKTTAIMLQQMRALHALIADLTASETEDAHTVQDLQNLAAELQRRANSYASAAAGD